MRENPPSANRMLPALLLAGVLHAAVMLGVRVELPEPAAVPGILEFSLASYTTDRRSANSEIPVPDRADVEQGDFGSPLLDASESRPSAAPRRAVRRREPTAAVRPADAAVVVPGSAANEESRPRQRSRLDPATSAVALRRTDASSIPSAVDEAPAPQPAGFEGADAKPVGSTDQSAGSAAVRKEPPVRLTAAALDQQISEWSAQYNQAQESEAVPSARTAYVEKVVGNRIAAAAYERAWQDKVERVGNMNYPEEARRKNLTGGLTLSVGVNADGSIQSIRVRKSSGHEELDQAAIRIVRLAAPFSRFPSELKKDYDVLLITRNWRFFIDHHLATSP